MRVDDPSMDSPRGSEPDDQTVSRRRDGMEYGRHAAVLIDDPSAKLDTIFQRQFAEIDGLLSGVDLDGKPQCAVASGGGLELELAGRQMGDLKTPLGVGSGFVLVFVMVTRAAS